MKSKRKATSLAIASVMALSCLTAGVATLTPVSAEGTETVQGFTYNTADFTVTQDYGAYVDGSVFSYPSGAEVYAGAFRKVGSKVRLDAGRNGVLFTSKASGDDAEGKKVSLAKEQTGDFSMDFRVFSQQSAVGHSYAEAARNATTDSSYQNTAVYDDQHNPFQDIRRVDITFTSVSNPDKAFTVKIFGNDTENTWTDSSAIVEVKGDTYTTGGVIVGYGICADGHTNECYANGEACMGHRTRLPGTSFTNVSRNTTSMPTSIWFDAENMKVYGKIYTETLNELGANGANVTEEYRLIRDMTSLPVVTKTDGWMTLSSDDFKDGYTVDIAVGDMTSNTTALKQPVWTGSWDNSEAGLANTAATPSPYVRCTSNDFDVNGDGTVDTNYTYDRYANFIIYDINGEALDVKDGWTVENTTLTTVNAGKYNISDGGPFAEPTWSGTDQYKNNLTALAKFGYAPGDVLQGLKFTSKVNNNGAVGEGFSLNVDDFTNADGAFAMKIGAEFDVSKSTTKWNVKTKDAYNTDHSLGNMNVQERGLGDYAEAIDQYSDVKELKITFRSTVDPSKAFNVYLVSRTSANTQVAVYTEIEGENYINSTMHRGWALNWGAYSYGDSQGTFGSRTVNLYGETDDTYCFPLIKFDPTTMGIYGLSAQNVFNYRTLSTAYEDARFENGVSATLDSSYFYNNGESTYTVSVSVERMNTKENVGVNQLSSFKGSWSTFANNLYVDGAQGAPTEGWDHQAVIHVYKLYDKTAMTSVNGEVKGTTVTAEEDFGLNFYYDLPYGNSATATMQMDGQEAVEVNGVYDNAKSLWRFTYPVAAKDYAKDVTVTLTKIDGIAVNGATYTKNVKDYTQDITNGDYSSESKELVASLTTYAESASAYFNKTATEKVTENVVAAADLAESKMSLVGSDDGVVMEGATLVLESKTIINVYFTATNVPVCTVNGTQVTAKAVAGQENLYVVSVEVDAKELSTMQTIVVGDYTLSYSAYSYIEMVVDKASPALYNVLQALYDYCEYAKAYLN